MNDTYVTAKSYLLNHNVLCLATSVDDNPWVAPVFYAIYSGKLVFLSAPHTQHCKNLAVNALASASIQEDYADWSQIKGFQCQGEVQAVDPDEVPAVIQAYSKKFPVTGADAPVEIANALERIRWFALSVKTIYFIDNSKGLGHRDELDPVRLLSG